MRIAVGGVVVLLGLVLAGCGLSDSPRAATSASVPAATATATGTAAEAAANPSDMAEPSYGTLPTYLPTDDDESDTVLTGTAGRPALTSQGDVVQVQLPEGSVSVLVSGPEVPAEGLPYDSPTSTCTWTITLSKASAQIPLDLAAFTTLDHFGATYRPELAAGEPKPPSSISPGQSVTFQLRARMKVGEGLMRWAPSGQNVASWDFVVETD